MSERSSIGVARAQLNSTVGDVAGDRGLIAAAHEAALDADADLVVTLGLSLVGYPPRDLLHRGALLDACEDALSDLAALTVDGPALVAGAPDRCAGPGRPLRNVAAVCADGEVVAKGAKRLLPTYDVFDENRYFRARGRSDDRRGGPRSRVPVTDSIPADDGVGPGSRVPALGQIGDVAFLSHDEVLHHDEETDGAQDDEQDTDGRQRHVAEDDEGDAGEGRHHNTQAECRVAGSPVHAYRTVVWRENDCHGPTASSRGASTESIRRPGIAV